jgi:NAD(P)-dependent dehydrogenase (short-subunit alcohol dehydrogenase family)
MSGSQLAGKVALITGATSGIGKATARRFAAEGATLLLTGRDRNRARSLLAELEEAGTAAQFVLGDLGQDAAIDELAAVARDRYGRVDALVLNAGVITVAPLTDITTAQYDEMMNVNVRAPWLCVKAMHALLPAGGTITVTASVSSFTIFPGEGAYCMGKAAVIHMVRALAVELGARRIRVNALCPGIVAVEGMSQRLAESSADPAAELAHGDDETPLGRAATLEEIATGALFLASKQSSFMTGSSLVLDGGLTIPRV